MIDFREASEALADLIALVTDSDMRRPTPCEDYAVSDLLLHIDEAATGFASAAGGASGTPAVADVDDQQSRLRVSDHVRDLARAWLAPQAWDGDSDLGGLELSNDTWGKIALTEVIVHGWDLAAATGHEFSPPESLVLACHDHVELFLPNAPIPQLWGDRVEIVDASLLERTVAIAGRDPRSWRKGPST